MEPLASMGFIFIFGAFFFWVVGSFMVAAYHSRGCSFIESLLISLFFSPFIGLLVNILEELKLTRK